ncbi:ACT domain-containing protein [Consotaella salsifontis]|uniref:Uncharacterized protein n=1 Tax=Consotaella salsifontis TaxID=1365950 RepID=A0A1T4PRH7_9HYPH|nr:ACT domain-containing protein [Consotaella salsifontis]SJZ94244.1 hypothetical protein SAMN05428963_104124 [Consotaella salsifontis]
MPLSVRLRRLPGIYAIAHLAPGSPIPEWADGEGFVSISRTDEELSVACRQEQVPAAVQQDREWRCLKLVGPFAFDESGVVLSVIRPISEAGLGVFVVSTFDGDHVLVKAVDLPQVEMLLEAAGHSML